MAYESLPNYRSVSSLWLSFSLVSLCRLAWKMVIALPLLALQRHLAAAVQPCIERVGIVVVHSLLRPSPDVLSRVQDISFHHLTSHLISHLLSAISSMRNIILTVSAANSIELVLTNRGWRTFSLTIFELTPPDLMLTPAFFSPISCRWRRSVTTLMELRPAFSASVVGMTSMASAKAFQQMASVPDNSRAFLLSWAAISISGAPPPAMRAFFLTRQRTTQRASCSDRSASSRMSELAPRTTTETVLPVDLVPVTFTMREPDDCTSSTRSALPSLSSVKESMSAMGLHPVDLQMNSTSSRSMSLTARMLSLARKCSERSLTASRRIDFWINSTLHLAFLIFLTMLRKNKHSSLTILSICL